MVEGGFRSSIRPLNQFGLAAMSIGEAEDGARSAGRRRVPAYEDFLCMPDLLPAPTTLIGLVLENSDLGLKKTWIPLTGFRSLSYIEK